MNTLPRSETLDCQEDRLFVTSDEQFVFYDPNASAFRVIHKNPNI